MHIERERQTYQSMATTTAYTRVDKVSKSYNIGRLKLRILPLKGILTALAIMTTNTNEDDGIGVVPIEARVDKSRMMI